MEKDYEYDIQEFTAGNKRFYRAIIFLENIKWLSENFYKTRIEAGDEARKIVYT